MSGGEPKNELEELDDLIIARLKVLQLQVDSINMEVGILKELFQRRMLKSDYLRRVQADPDRE